MLRWPTPFEATERAVGGAVALNLLFGVPLPVGGIITAVVAFVLLGAQSRGHRPFERVITGLLLVIGLGIMFLLLAWALLSLARPKPVQQPAAVSTT